MTPEERDDAAQEPETNDTPGAEGQPPEAEEGQEPEAEEPEAGEAEEPAAEAEEPAAEAEEPAAEAEEPAAEAEEPAAEAAEGTPDEAAAEERSRGRRPESDKKPAEEELIPGAHLEPDLVLEEEQRPQNEFGEYAEVGEAGEESGAGETAGEGADTAPVAHEPIALAADARYSATGKRKRAVARVILKPGEGTYTINSRHLDEYFPRVRLQRMARQPLEATGYQTRMDVVARIHGGGVAAQATALRHGVARALVEADPALRGELKRRGYLTRDPRVKERKKAGLKKARKRPQFSKR